MKNALEEVLLQLESTQQSKRRQAKALPVALVVAMERAALDLDMERFKRAYAWYRLAKLWGAMRYHDTTGLDFSSARLGAGWMVRRLEAYQDIGTGKASGCAEGAHRP